MTGGGSRERVEGRALAGDLKAWPPRERSQVLELIVALYERREPLTLEDAAEIFDPEVVLHAIPASPSRAFRPYFGLAGAVECDRHWQWVRSVAGVLPEAYLATGDRAVVLTRVSRPDGDMAPGWVFSARDGRLREIRGYRYPSEALARFSALTSGGAGSS